VALPRKEPKLKSLISINPISAGIHIFLEREAAMVKKTVAISIAGTITISTLEGSFK
jgi:hypothetical protein